MLKRIGVLSILALCARTHLADAAGCPTAGGGCGLNGGWLGENIAFHELDSDFNKSVPVTWDGQNGATESGTLQIKAFKRANEAASAPSAELVVVGDRLKARRAGTDIEELGGWVMTVELTSNHATRTFFLTITETRRTPYWTGPACFPSRPDGTCIDDAANVPLYRFMWTERGVNKPARSVCGPDQDPDDSGFRGNAVIFTGNHYEESTFAVKKNSDKPEWKTRFNISCVGTALAKLHLHRHTEAAQPPRATVDQQQALLRMLTGDYCGIGNSMTRNYRQLEYTYKQTEWYPLYPPFSPGKNDALDGVWDRDGAVCIQEPRLHQTASAIRAACPQKNIPLCSMINWKLRLNRTQVVNPRARPDVAELKKIFGQLKGYAVAVWDRTVADPPSQ